MYTEAVFRTFKKKVEKRLLCCSYQMAKRSLSLFLARRFYQTASGDQKRRASKLAINIATAGVALGLAVMIVSICVVKGFQNEISSKLTGFSSHITILNDSSLYSPESYPIVVDSAFVHKISGVSGVKHVQRVSMKLGILKTDESYQSISLKGIADDYDTTFIADHMVDGVLPHFTDQSSTNKIVISQLQADVLGLKVGGRVFSYFFEETIKMRKFEIAGIYQTNLPQFDEHFVLTDLYTVNRLNKWDKDQSSCLEIHLADMDDLDNTQIQIGRLINGKEDCFGSTYESLSIKENPETGPALSWLEVLNMNVWVILGLMTGVAGFTMISGLLILILERTRTIGVLKAMGATNTRIRKTFIAYAAMIVVRGLIFGNVFGLGLVLLQQWFGLVKLDPVSYYVSEAPVLIHFSWILTLNVATLLITVMALVVPSYVISRIQPAKTIQFD